jgi:hypothetical protein
MTRCRHTNTVKSLFLTSWNWCLDCRTHVR